MSDRITATINNITTGPRNVSVTVPSASTRLNALGDVNVSSLADGAMLQYDDTSKKWTSRNDIKTESGNLILNGGTF
jgi:hypothetical protein